MGFLYKHLLHPMISRVTGHKAFTNNPYLGFAIDAGDNAIADELFSISLAYQHGQYSLPKDNGKAKEYCFKAAERGHVVAQNFAIQWSMRRNDDTSDSVMYWLRKAAEQGEKQALFNLGISYHRGDIDGTASVQKSNELFRQSAEFGYLPAYTRMAQIYYNGEGVEKNNTIAKYWAMLEYSNMSEHESEKSILNILLEESDITEDKMIDHKKIVEEAAKAGERDAMNNWASGLRQTGNKAEGIKVWKKAVESGHPLAMCNLARQLWTDEVKDYKQAKELLEKSASLGFEGAYYCLAVMYYQGLGVEKDIKKSWSYLERSLNFGNNDARYLFATMCFNNELQGVIPDIYGRGWHYMELAAQQGYEPAIEFFKHQNGQ